MGSRFMDWIKKAERTPHLKERVPKLSKVFNYSEMTSTAMIAPPCAYTTLEWSSLGTGAAMATSDTIFAGGWMPLPEARVDPGFGILTENLVAGCEDLPAKARGYRCEGCGKAAFFLKPGADPGRHEVVRAGDVFVTSGEVPKDHRPITCQFCGDNVITLALERLKDFDVKSGEEVSA